MDFYLLVIFIYMLLSSWRSCLGFNWWDCDALEEYVWGGMCHETPGAGIKGGAERRT